MQKLYLLLFFCFFTTLVVAQSTDSKLKYIENEAVKNLPYQPTDVNIIFYIFQKVNSNMRLEEFTQNDADALMLYFLNKNNIWACQTHSVDKSVKIITPLDAHIVQSLHHRNLSAELLKMGYRVFSYRAAQETIFFESNKPGYQSQTKNLPISQKIKDCNDCGEAKISQELLNKFKDANYGTSQINFGENESEIIDSTKENPFK